MGLLRRHPHIVQVKAVNPTFWIRPPPSEQSSQDAWCTSGGQLVDVAVLWWSRFMICLIKATGAPGSGAPGGTLGPRGGPPSEQLSRDFASALCTSGGQLVNVAESTHRLRLRTFLGTGRPRGLPETCEFLF